MAGWRRGAAATTRGTLLLLLLPLLLCVSPAYPHPTLTSPPPSQPALTTTSSPRAGSGWSLKDTVLRLDELLQRHNDYNDVMLESGEEDDQLSRLLYRLQHGDRVREGWYDDEPLTLTQPQPPIPRQGTTTRTHRNRREHRPESTGFTRPAVKALTHKEKKAKKSKGKRGVGKRSR